MSFDYQRQSSNLTPLCGFCYALLYSSLAILQCKVTEMESMAVSDASKYCAHLIDGRKRFVCGSSRVDHRGWHL
jgi:hypothetical protein